MPPSTTVITVEAHDTLVSVRDRLSWAKTPRILLRLPGYENVKLSLLDLKVLQRHARALGAQLGLVTRNRSLKRDARALGLPVFESSAAAQRGRWPGHARRVVRAWRPPRHGLRVMQQTVRPGAPAWPAWIGVRAAAFAMAVLAVTGISANLLTRAEVIIYPEVETREEVVTVAVSTDAMDLSPGAVPGYPLEGEVTVEEETAVYGTLSIPRTRAGGFVRFANLTKDEVQVPAGAVVYALAERPIRFRTLEEASLAPGADGIADVLVEAVLAGAEGNLEEGSIVGIEGPIGISVEVMNPEPLSGGSDEAAVGASEKERSELRQTAIEHALVLARAQLRASLAEGDALIEDSILVTQVLEEEYSPPAGQPGKTLRLSARVAFAGRYVPGSALRQIAAASELDLPPGYATMGRPQVEVSRIDAEAGGNTLLEVVVRGTLYRSVDSISVLQLVRGRTAEEAALRLDAHLRPRHPSSVLVRPRWWPWVPLSPLGLSITLR